MENLKKEIIQYISSGQHKTAVIHSDIVFGFPVKITDRDQFLQSHIDELSDILQGLDMWFPTFNYDFCQGVPFNVSEDKSSVGNLSEYFRTNVAKWRCPIPVFTYAGTGTMPTIPCTGEVDPFGEFSLFAQMDNAVLIHYGSTIKATTYIHYVERMSGNLLYRYDKLFRGIVKENNAEREVVLRFHVRPKDLSLSYRWEFIEQDLINQGLLIKLRKGRTIISLGRFSEINLFWQEKMKEDPLYFLDPQTRIKVETKLNELGRAFVISDFE